MDPVVLRAAWQLVHRARARGLNGRTAILPQVEALDRDIGGRMPRWFRELLTSVPLCGLELGWSGYPPDEDDPRGIAWMGWSGVEEIRQHSLDLHPGVAILDRGYLNVATDLDGNGDPYFIPVGGAEDPPVYRVYDEVTWGPDEVLAKGLVLVAPTLSRLFDTAMLVGD